jgi:hypothetical protein
MTRLRLCVLLLTAALAPAVAGCSHGNTTTAASSVRAQALPVWQEFANCLRSHGVPRVPDPQVDDNGQATWPGRSDAEMQRGQQIVGNACDSILQKLPPQAQPHANNQIGTQDLATLRRWAQCMRAHGLPDFPDPNSDGIFTLPDRYASGGKAMLKPAQDACKDIYNGSFRTG